MKILKAHKDDIIITKNETNFKMNKATEKIVEFMADKLYTNKYYSVFREIFSNSVDAHLDSKTKDPIDITFKIDLEANEFIMIFRDYGKGIPKDKIVDIYCTFFNSSKSGTNNQIGGYGLGSKSPISITDKYYITNIHGGIKYFYKVSKVNKCMEIELLSEKKTDEKSGLEVSIPIKRKVDNYTFDESTLITSYAKQILCACPIKVRLNLECESIKTSQIINDSNTLIGKHVLFVNYKKYINLINDFIAKVDFDEKLEMDKNIEIYEENNTIESYGQYINILNGCIPYEVNLTNYDLEEHKTSFNLSIVESKKGYTVHKILKTINILYPLICKTDINIECNLDNYYEIFLISNIGELDISTSRENIIVSKKNKAHIKSLINRSKADILNLYDNNSKTEDFTISSKSNIKSNYKTLFNLNDVFMLFYDKEDKKIYRYINKTKILKENFHNPYLLVDRETDKKIRPLVGKEYEHSYLFKDFLDDVNILSKFKIGKCSIYSNRNTSKLISSNHKDIVKDEYIKYIWGSTKINENDPMKDKLDELFATISRLDLEIYKTSGVEYVDKQRQNSANLLNILF